MQTSIIPQVSRRQSPLTERESAIVACVVNRSDIGGAFQIAPDDIWTIRTQEEVAWVHLHNRLQLPFDLRQFKAEIANAKENFLNPVQQQETAKEQNTRLKTEIGNACRTYKLNHSKIDYLSFSTDIYKGHQKIGSVGYTLGNKQWYCCYRSGNCHSAASADAAVNALELTH